MSKTELKAGQSWSELMKAEELEKGAVKDAIRDMAVGASMAATVGAMAAAHNEHKPQVDHAEGMPRMVQVSVDGAHNETAPTTGHPEVDAKITQDHAKQMDKRIPAAAPIKKMEACLKCGDMDHDLEKCMKDKSYNQLKKEELEKANAPKAETKKILTKAEVDIKAAKVKEALNKIKAKK